MWRKAIFRVSFGSSSGLAPKKPDFPGLIDGPGGLSYKPRQSRTINDFTRIDGAG
jgi:hypothetical protein